MLISVCIMGSTNMHNDLLLMAFHWWSLEKYLISSLNVLFLLWKFTIVSKICSNFAKEKVSISWDFSKQSHHQMFVKCVMVKTSTKWNIYSWSHCDHPSIDLFWKGGKVIYFQKNSCYFHVEEVHNLPMCRFLCRY